MMKKKIKFYIVCAGGALFLLTGVFFFCRKEASAVQREKSIEEKIEEAKRLYDIEEGYTGSVELILYGDGRQETVVDGKVVKTKNIPNK